MAERSDLMNVLYRHYQHATRCTYLLVTLPACVIKSAFGFCSAVAGVSKIPLTLRHLYLIAVRSPYSSVGKFSPFGIPCPFSGAPPAHSGLGSDILILAAAQPLRRPIPQRLPCPSPTAGNNTAPPSPGLRKALRARAEPICPRRYPE